jgi:hypothetical protein
VLREANEILRTRGEAAKNDFLNAVHQGRMVVAATAEEPMLPEPKSIETQQTDPLADLIRNAQAQLADIEERLAWISTEGSSPKN